MGPPRSPGPKRATHFVLTSSTLINRVGAFLLLPLFLSRLSPDLAGAHLIGCLFVYFGNGMLLANRTDLHTVPAAAQLAAMTVTGLLLIPPFQLAGVVASRYSPIEHRWSALIALAVTLLVFAAFSSVLTSPDVGFDIVARAAVWLVFLVVAWSIVVGGNPLRQSRSAAAP